jgi:hypothetical protein
MEESDVEFSDDVLFAIASRCKPVGLANMMEVDERFAAVAQSNSVWVPILKSLNVDSKYDGSVPAIDIARHKVLSNVCNRTLPSTVNQITFQLRKNEHVLSSHSHSNGRVSLLTHREGVFYRVELETEDLDTTMDSEKIYFEGLQRHMTINESRCHVHKHVSSVIYSRTDYGPRFKKKLVEKNRTTIESCLIHDGDFAISQHGGRVILYNWVIDRKFSLEQWKITSVSSILHKNGYVVLVTEKEDTKYHQLMIFDERTMVRTCNIKVRHEVNGVRFDPLVDDLGRLRGLLMINYDRGQVDTFKSAIARFTGSLSEFEMHTNRYVPNHRFPIAFWGKDNAYMIKFTKEYAEFSYHRLQKAYNFQRRSFYLGSTVPGVGLMTWNILNGRLKFSETEGGNSVIFNICTPVATSPDLLKFSVTQARDDHVILTSNGTHVLVEW